MAKLLADTGFLVALGRRADPLHRAAAEFLAGFRGEIVVPGPAVVETCFFLATAGKVRLLDWVSKDPVKLVELPQSAYVEIGTILARYANLDPDFTDAAMVWLAGSTGCRSILTVDERDFSVYRLKGGKRFEIVRWFH